MTEVNSCKKAANRVRMGVALKLGLLGLGAGAFFFYVLQPLLLGWRPSPILERGATLVLFFRTFPLIVLPFVILTVMFFGPKSKGYAFWSGLMLSACFLIPIPLLDFWCVAPKDVGEHPFSETILLELAYGLAGLGSLATVASVCSALVSPRLYGLFMHK